jgi:hypothetical protein
MAIHNLNETLKKKGVEFNRPCRIFEVCIPHQPRRCWEKTSTSPPFSLAASRYSWREIGWS